MCCFFCRTTWTLLRKCVMNNLIKYMIVLAFVTIASAMFGYIDFYNYSFFDSLYKSFQLFALGGSEFPEQSMCINFARFLAPIVTVCIGAQLIHSVARNGWRKICLGLMRNHIIVCGCGFTGKKIVDNAILHKKVVVIDPKLKEYNSLNKVLISEDATDIKTLIEAQVKRASQIIIATGDDYINLLIYKHVSNLNLPNLEIKVRIEKIENQDSLNDLIDSKSKSTHAAFNFSELAVDSLKPIDTSNIIILGSGSIGNRLVKKYCGTKKILVLEQSDTVIEISKDKLDDKKNEVDFKKVDVKHLIEADLIHILLDFKFIEKSKLADESKLIEVYICLGGDWLGFHIARKWAKWTKVKMNINLIGSSIPKDLFNTLSNTNEYNKIDVYNIVDDTLNIISNNQR